MRYGTPIFVQAGLGKNSQQTSELLTRWNRYGRILEAQTKGSISRIVVFLPRPIGAVNVDHYKNLEVIFFVDSLIGRLSIYFKLRRRISHLRYRLTTLVAGDNYVSPVILYAVKIFCPASIRIQIQFHGATYVKSGNGVAVNLKHLLLRIAISCADSIRIVSDFQRNDIQSLTSKKKDFVVAPIPISMAKIPSRRPYTPGLSVLVLGRLHPERGILEILELIEMLAAKNFDCTFHFVGEGPLSNRLNLYTNNFECRTKIILHGLKDEVGVRYFLSKSNLLVSFAEEEGYGLSIREAILSGVHVLAKRNRGTQEVLSLFPGRIDLMENPTQALKFIESFSPSKIDESELERIRKAQEFWDEDNLKCLVNSWI